MRILIRWFLHPADGRPRRRPSRALPGALGAVVRRGGGALLKPLQMVSSGAHANICSVRWSNLRIDAEETARLPGYRDEAVVRHFEAPGAVQTRFYEVRAKSILNHVPEASQMPFRWTINPYRGCTHACSYCVRGETPILMADGKHKPME